MVEKIQVPSWYGRTDFMDPGSVNNQHFCLTASRHRVAASLHPSGTQSRKSACTSPWETKQSACHSKVWARMCCYASPFKSSLV